MYVPKAQQEVFDILGALGLLQGCWALGRFLNPAYTAGSRDAWQKLWRDLARGTSRALRQEQSQVAGITRKPI